MKIALDLDGVLADLQNKMIQETQYTRSDFEQWDKPEYNHFMSEASRIWREQWDEISSVEHNIDMKTEQLAQDHHVDIVTNTAGPNEAIEKWLDEHGVRFESIVRPYSKGSDKHHLGYDAYIDDKPGMAGRVDVLYLRDRPWNRHLRGTGPHLYHDMANDSVLSVDPYESDASWVIRVMGLDDVIEDLDWV